MCYLTYFEHCVSRNRPGTRKLQCGGGGGGGGRGEGGNPTALVLRYGLCSQLSKASTPEKQKKMTFDYFAGKTADVWEMEEGLSGLSLDSAKDKQLSPKEDDTTTTDTFTTKVKLGIMWLAWYACV